MVALQKRGGGGSDCANFSDPLRNGGKVGLIVPRYGGSAWEWSQIGGSRDRRLMPLSGFGVLLQRDAPKHAITAMWTVA